MIFPGPLDYLGAFALVLATGLALGILLGWLGCTWASQFRY